MKREDDEELWDLLGKAAEPALSPFFARNVLRDVRRLRVWRLHVQRWMMPGRAISAAAALAVCLVTALMISQTRTNNHGGENDADDVPEVVAQIDPSDYEVVADLDDLLAAQEDDSWNDTATL